MKILTITSGWTSYEHFVLDDARADAAYDAIRKAMAEYDKFGNDKEKSVTVELADGNSTTFRVETLTVADLCDCAAAEATLVEREVWKRSTLAKVTARLAPSDTGK